MHLGSSGGGVPADGPEMPVQLGPVHYVDDTAVPIVATVATDILERLAAWPGSTAASAEGTAWG